MRGEQAPDGARIGFARPAIVPWNAKLSMRDTLADKHADKIMVGYHQQFSWIWKSLVLRKPARIAMTMRTDDWQLLHSLEKGARHIPGSRFERKKSVWVGQRHVALRGARKVRGTMNARHRMSR